MLLRGVSLRMVLAVIAVVLHGGAGVCSAQEVGSEAWFHAAWKTASEWKVPQPLHIRVEFEQRHYVDAASLAALRAKVDATNDLADKHRLETMEREAAHPVVKWTTDVCTDGERVRFTTSTSGPGMQGMSVALGKETDWMLEGNFLKLASRIMEEPAYGLRNFKHTADNIIRTTIWAGFGDDQKGGLEPLSCSVNGGLWEGKLGRAGKEPAICIVQGRAAPSGMPSVQGMMIFRQMLADPTLRAVTPLGTMECVGWTENEALGRPVVEETRWVDGEGRPTQTMKLVFLKFITPMEMDELMAVPQDGKQDPWVGPVKVAQTQDVRPGLERQTIKDNGVEHVVPLQVPLGPGEGESLLNGWYVPAGLVAAAVGLGWFLRNRGK